MNKMFLLLVIVVSMQAFALDIDAKAKSSFGFALTPARDNSWATEKTADAYAGDKETYKTIVGLTLKNEDTKLYWETKFQASSTAVAMSAAYLYIDTTLTNLPGALRIGFQRMGILDAETHPYADGSFYTYCKDKGTGISYYTQLFDLDIKITHLGLIPGLDSENLANSSSKSFFGLLARSGNDYGLGLIYSNDSNYSSTNISGISLYGDYATMIGDLKLTGTAFYDLTTDASKAYLTSKTVPKAYIGIYGNYKLLPDLSVYGNALFDNSRVNISTKYSGGIKYALSSKVSSYIHYEYIKNKNDVNEDSALSMALETSI